MKNDDECDELIDMLIYASSSRNSSITVLADRSSTGKLAQKLLVFYHAIADGE